jgi:colicin import membrane protein
MHASLISQIKNHPRFFFLSIAVHVILLVIVTISLSDPSAPKLPVAKKVDTVKAVVIDASVVKQEIQKIKQAEEKKRNQKVAQKKKLDRQVKKAREQRKKEEKRLANLKLKEKKRKQELAKKEKSQRDKKKKELAKLKKQQEELVNKRKVEQKKLADIEKKRKTAEAEAKKKKLAAEANARRKEQEAEMRQQMLAEERRMAKQSAANQKLLAQYLYQIQRKIVVNWIPPASMTKGWSCEVHVEQNRFGELKNVQMKKCTGSEAFKSTLERAVRKASPLPEAPNNDIFEKKLNFVFTPEL